MIEEFFEVLEHFWNKDDTERFMFFSAIAGIPLFAVLGLFSLAAICYIAMIGILLLEVQSLEIKYVEKILERNGLDTKFEDFENCEGFKEAVELIEE